MQFRNREHAVRLLAEKRGKRSDVVCLYAPDFFIAVGQFFDDFSQVTDEQVIATLRQAHVAPPPSV